MKKAKKAELHEFVMLAVETTEGGKDKAMFRWCKRCGLVEVTSSPYWGSHPLFLVPGDLEFLQGGSRWGRQSPPVCRLSRLTKGLPS